MHTNLLCMKRWAWTSFHRRPLWAQARHILCDIFLYFFNVATLGASFASVRRGLTPKQQAMWCAVTGAMLGCCMSVKLTALGVFACIGVHQLLCLFVSYRSCGDFWIRGLTRAGIILSVRCRRAGGVAASRCTPIS